MIEIKKKTTFLNLKTRIGGDKIQSIPMVYDRFYHAWFWLPISRSDYQKHTV